MQHLCLPAFSILLFLVSLPIQRCCFFILFYSLSLYFFRGINHICVPCLVFFSCIYRILDRDNKVKNYLCYLIPHTTKSLIFPNALLFSPAIITCMELFVYPQNCESSLTTIRLVCIIEVVQECNIYDDNLCLEKALVLQQMFLSHWLACVFIGPHWQS